MKKFLLAILFGGLSVLQADVSYVDASLANMDNAAGGSDSTWADGDDGTTGGSAADGTANNDGLWRFRGSLGGNGIWEATGSSAQAEDCAELVVSAPVANGDYDVYVFYFAVNSSGSYPIRAGFASNPNANPPFTRQTGQNSGDLTFVTAPPQDATRTLLYGYVGQTTVSAGTLQVYIDDFPASTTGSSNDRTWFAGVGYEVASGPPPAVVPDQVMGDLIVIDPDAGWTWYTDERAIIDYPRLIAGGVRGKDWFGSVGDILCTEFNLETGKRMPFVLGPPPIKDPANVGSGDTSEDKDDHNTASFIKLPDGHYVAAWSSHSENNQVHLRRSTNPHDATAWNAGQLFERSVADGASGPNDVTYTNLIYLSAEGTGQGRLYNFIRNDTASDWDRYFIYSDDLGLSWQWGGRHTGQNDPSIRPYPKYATNGNDTIYYIVSETASGNNIWSGYMRNGKNHKMNGVVVDNDIFDNTAFPVGDYTPVMMEGETDGGVSMQNLWPRDLVLDPNGKLAATWRGLGNGSNTDWRHFYGTLDGTTWNWSRLAFMGDFNSLLQQDGATPHRGTPLSAVNPADANEVWFTANSDPATGTPVVSAANGTTPTEVYKAVTGDGGTTWAYTQLTKDSSCNNFRLTVLPWDGNNTAVMWMRGYYDRWYFNASNDGWDSVLVAYLEREGEAYSRLAYTDADASNTTLADGSVLAPTSGTGAGANDGLWHFRTNASFGNGGTLYTANESSPYDEDVPSIKTTVANVPAGVHDIYVCFWSLVSGDYDVMAGLDAAALMQFERQGSQHVTAGDFDTTTVLVDDGSRFLYRAYAGRVDLAVAGDVEVFIDTLTAGDDSSSNRTWYDGVALKVAASSLVDSDGDGCSDADELIAGTDWNDGADYFSVESITKPAGGTVDIGVAGKAGRVYQLWRSTDLNTWIPIEPVLGPVGTDALIQLSDPSPPAGRAFYRVAVSYPQN